MLDLYIHFLASQFGRKLRTSDAGKHATEVVNEIWKTLAGPRCARKARPPTNLDLIDHNVTKEIMTSAWQHKWQEQREARRGLQNLGTAWMTEWSVCRKKLYKGLKRHEATALFLLHSQVLGVRECLYRIGIPNMTPECPCGWHTQTVQHLLIHCPRMPTATLRQRVESGDIYTMLNTPGKAQATARWFIETGLLSQFAVARQIGEENPQSYGQLTPW